MKVTVLASGSRGNATLFETATTRVLVDAGVSPGVLAKRMATAGITRPLTAVVITHAHGDHHAHAAEVSVQWKIPVYVTEATKRGISLGNVPTRTYGAREPFAIGDMTVHPLPIPHDAPQVALRISAHGHAAAIVTDLGEVPPALLGHLKGCDTVLIESNHDVDMLWRGPYTASLKRRIVSSRGHLSNAQTHGLLRALPKDVRTVVLMHLSEKNNRADIALASAMDALSEHTVKLLAAGQDTVTSVDTVGQPQMELFASG